MAAALSRFAEKASPIGEKSKTMLKNANPFSVDPISKARKALRKEARGVLGRGVSIEQTRAIERANELGSVEAGVSSAESARRARILRENGFSEADVKKLAATGVLKNHPGTLAPVAILPEKAFTADVKLRSFDRHAIKELQTADKDLRNVELRYVIDVDDQIYILDDAAEAATQIPGEPLWVARNLTPGKNVPATILVKETGVVRKIEKQIRFQPHSGTELTGIELEQAFLRIQASEPELLLRHPKVATAAESRVLNCIDVMSGQLAGKSFVMDSLVAGNLISIGSIAATELAGAGRWDSKDGPRVIAADLLGGNANSLIATSITKALLLSNMGRTKQFAVRAGLGMVTTRVQDQVYKAVLPGAAAKERAEALTEFNTWHFYLKLPLNVLIDEGIMKKLPVTLFDICKRGGALKVVLSPQAVRIYEKTASTMAYFALRGIFVDEETAATEKRLVKKVRHTLQEPLNIPKRSAPAPSEKHTPATKTSAAPDSPTPLPPESPRANEESLAILPPELPAELPAEKPAAEAVESPAAETVAPEPEIQ